MIKRPTLKDIAKKLNISITTVSKALKDHPDISLKQKKKILEVTEELGYIPNKLAIDLRSRKSKFIGLVITDNTNPYFAEIIQGAEKIISKNNYYTIIFNSYENITKEILIVKEMISIGVAGVIITPARGNNSSIDLLKKYNIPFVLANRYFKKNKDNYVIANDFKAGYMATDYLIKQGRRKNIIFIGSYNDISSARDRLQGFKAAMKKNKLKLSKNQVYSDIIDKKGGYEVAKDILTKFNPPFSLLCYSDYIAIGVIKYFSEKKIKIPEEITIMGIDGIELFDFLKPKLHSIVLPKYEIGEESATLLIKLINNKRYSKNRIILEPKVTDK